MYKDDILQHKAMPGSLKRKLMEDTEPAPKKMKPISFSISSILGHVGDKKASGDVIVKRETLTPLVSAATERLFPYAKENSNYSEFKSAIHYRACSTPEDDECPSPTLPVPVQPYHSLLPPQIAVLPHDKYSYAHAPLTSTGLTPLSSGYVGVPLRPSFTRYQPYRTPSLDSVGDTRHTSPDSTSDDFIHRADAHSRLSAYPDVQQNPSNHRQVNHSDHGLDSLGESYHNSPSPSKCRKKKTRTVFSRNQIYQLESAFDLKRYLSTAERSSLASRLQLSETQVKIWFQNRRNKWKRQISGEMDEIPLPPAFHMPGLISPPFSHQSLSAYPSMADPRDELLRSRLVAHSMYPSYSQESRFLPPIL